MFFFRKLFGLFFLGILVLGFLGLFGRGGHGGHGRYQSAYHQGFIDGQQSVATNSEAAPAGAEKTTTATPNQIPGANVYFRGYGFFFPGFGLMFCLIPLFFFGLFFMVFGKRRRHHRGHWGHHRRGQGPWGHGPCGHRMDREKSPQEKSPDDIDDGPDEPIMRA